VHTERPSGGGGRVRRGAAVENLAPTDFVFFRSRAKVSTYLTEDTMSILIDGLLVRASVHPARCGLLLKVELHDWHAARAGGRIVLTLNGVPSSHPVRSVTRCPGGEPEAWVWLGPGEEIPASEREVGSGARRIGGRSRW
jgi:hypothetical protein